jgi:hypothetical protein
MLALPRRHVLAALALLVALLALPAHANAGVLVRSSPSCETQPLEHPFSRWLDPAAYTLVADGTFEHAGAGWRLDGASVVAENEPYRVHGDAAVAALALPAGSSATSPAICVGLEHPTLRFFARNTGSVLGALQVEVLFEDALGAVHSLPVGVVLGKAGWQPTLPLPVVANLLPLLPGEHTPVAFRFTATGVGSAWQVDDVYVDPYRKG